MSIYTRKQLLAWDLSKDLNDKKNFGFYCKLAERFSETTLRSVLSFVKDSQNFKEIEKKGAYFVKILYKKRDPE